MSKDNDIKQKDIHNAAWSACDSFRGVMDAAGYKDYILVMLFLNPFLVHYHYNTYFQVDYVL